MPNPVTDVYVPQPLSREKRLSNAAHKNWCSHGDSCILAFMELIKVLKTDGWAKALDRLGKYWAKELTREHREKSGLINLLKKGIEGASKKEINKGWEELYSNMGRTTWIGIQFVEELIDSENDSIDHEYYIHLEGDFYRIKFGNEEKPYKVCKAIGYLVKILAQPNKTLTVGEVLGDPENKIKGDSSLTGERENDSQAISKIKKRIQDIEDIEESTGGSALIADEKAILLSKLENQTRHTQTPQKKAHHNICTQIRDFRKKIKDDMPNFENHLKSCLKMNMPEIGYYPIPRINWII